jgi:ADP-ribose pyrophosphatase
MAKSASKKSAKARVISSRVSYKGPVFSVTTDEVEEPGGVRARRDVIRHSGSIVILAVEEAARAVKGSEPRILLEHQYRHAAQSMMWELPAGRIDDGETALTAAKRELLEETGFTARQWKRILHFYVSPGFLDETMTIYLARPEGGHGAARGGRKDCDPVRSFVGSQADGATGAGKRRQNDCRYFVARSVRTVTAP